MTKHVFNIYSHADADGGIAAAIFGRHFLNVYEKFGWEIKITPVDYGAGPMEWPMQRISWPCAIIDFSLHPMLLDPRFFQKQGDLSQRMGAEKVPPCYWIDHHPTGSSYGFLTPQNTQSIMPDVIAKWDVEAISTPGLLRTHRHELALDDSLIASFEEYIDYAEILDGALYATAESAHDYASPAVKLGTLFHPSHPAIDKTGMYKQLVRAIMSGIAVEDLFDADPLYAGLFAYERSLHAKKLASYKHVTKRIDNVAVANFAEGAGFAGIGRFLPYLLFPDVQYAIHIFPKHGGKSQITCGINPWNKPLESTKHLGNYFAENFGGGGHSFVAGGRVAEEEFSRIESLISFIHES